MRLIFIRYLNKSETVWRMNGLNALQGECITQSSDSLLVHTHIYDGEEVTELDFIQWANVVMNLPTS